ncbi:gamma carbonic anhydrase family protein [Flammeovirga yaeyamensis]|uniref:Gamma carbonic anhydrase family protein n=1 Tax=Flammeovirga yaeyamensis TaxID=367791 RepID=A0AAX1NCQ1_9BACT|nr:MULTISPECIES: gamma carbonic anhydrase family protein [Flammeovirga]ANQ48635.1 gamma carbonic anhydrase family protein [Flammeovirga sp. MY04]MBB3698719.1 carbonic anhydrase/acetyltransferase-like protein (isoleucine patch superfamily) [Flammeovirga yaeyamensis]NMF37305.1 gamma carbonic anhydrase family protein [Flammeovirga yaeyamensis]QWG03877.1 gamma carbonic anhydrase family protein [Flammeovirga yaeyamensis]
MALIRKVKGIEPQIGENTFLAENCTVVGDVTMGKDCSVWFSAVVRGDVNKITIGDKCNIQDGAVIHATYKTSATTLGNNVSVGHNALVHGCTIHDNVLVGMGAIVMDDAVVEENVLIAAGAVVLQNSRLESGYLYGGIPAKKIKPLDDKLKAVFERTANNYVMYSSWFEDEE